MTEMADGMCDMSALVYEQIRDFGGAATDLGMFMWPRLTDDQRVGAIFDGDGDPWAIAAATLEVCPVDVVVPEGILAAFEEEAKYYAAKYDFDVYARMAVETVRKHRKYHPTQPADTGVAESPAVEESPATP